MISDQHSATGTFHSRLQTPAVYYMSTMNVPSLETACHLKHCTHVVIEARAQVSFGELLASQISDQLSRHENRFSVLTSSRPGNMFYLEVVSCQVDLTIVLMVHLLYVVLTNYSKQTKYKMLHK